VNRLGTSYAVSALIGFVVAAAAAAIAYGVLLPKFNMAAAAAEDVAARLQEAGEVKITVIYHIGTTMLISNDGSSTIRIVKLYVGVPPNPPNPQTFNPPIVLKPGDKYQLFIPSGAKEVAAELDSGVIVVLKSER